MPATIENLKAKGVDVLLMDQTELNTNSINGELLLTILAGIAQFEISLRAERQAEGIAKALKNDVKFDRTLELTEEH